MSTSTSYERSGEVMVLGQAMIYGLFPVLLSYSGGKIPPMFFAAVSTALAGCVVFCYLLWTNTSHDLLNSKAYPSLLKLSLIISGGYILFYLGGSQTTGINISILSQVEIVFTFLFAGLLFGESMPAQKIIAAVMVFVGTLFIVYNGVLEPNPGDLLILGATAAFPFANRNAQKAMQHISPQAVILVRYFFGTIIFVLASIIWEGPEVFSIDNITQYWWLILMNGVVIFSLTKVMWYEGLRRIDLSKAITLGMSFTAFGVLYSMFLLGEIPSLFQVIGFITVMAGIFVITRKNHLPATLSETP